MLYSQKLGLFRKPERLVPCASARGETSSPRAQLYGAGACPLITNTHDTRYTRPFLSFSSPYT